MSALPRSLGRRRWMRVAYRLLVIVAATSAILAWEWLR